MTLDDYIADPANRFATVAMADTNGLLRGQMVSTGSLRGIARNGMGMAPAQLALAGRIDAITTAPLHKAALWQAGHHYPGHTELLAELCGGLPTHASGP